jgi:lipase
LEVAPDHALRKAEVDRLDWSFATRDGAVNALLATETVVAAPRDVIVEYVREHTKQGSDERYRFDFCPSAVVTAWSEMSRPAPPIALVKTLVVYADASFVSGKVQQQRYRDALGAMLTTVSVPNGHNVLWETPNETIDAIEAFLVDTKSNQRPIEEIIAGYRDESGSLHPLF